MALTSRRPSAERRTGLPASQLCVQQAIRSDLWCSGPSSAAKTVGGRGLFASHAIRGSDNLGLVRQVLVLSPGRSVSDRLARVWLAVPGDAANEGIESAEIILFLAAQASACPLSRPQSNFQSMLMSMGDLVAAQLCCAERHAHGSRQLPLDCAILVAACPRNRSQIQQLSQYQGHALTCILSDQMHAPNQAALELLCCVGPSTCFQKAHHLAFAWLTKEASHVLTSEATKCSRCQQSNTVAFGSLHSTLIISSARFCCILLSCQCIQEWHL